MTTDLGPGSLDTSDRSRQSLTVVAGGSIAEAAAAGAAAVLAIIGLAGTKTELMMCVATIAIGAAFLLREGGLMAQSLRYGTRARGADLREAVFGNGLTAATIAGATGVALGVLALVDVDPWVLVPAALIVFGGGVILDNANNSTVLSYQQRVDVIDRSAGGTALTAAGGELLVGVGVAVLGILALIGISPVTLSLVGLLALGVSTFLVGSAISTKLMMSAR